MQTCILRVYRVHPADVSVSGMLEDVESGQKKHVNNLIDLITVLAKTIGKGQLELADEATKQSTPVAMAGSSRQAQVELQLPAGRPDRVTRRAQTLS